MLRRLSRMCQAEKVSVSVVAGSSTRQWVYDAGAISHGVTASNLVLARILTDTSISRSPHCVLGARYDGNVNLFYVVMTGSGKPRVSMVFPGTNSISSSRFAGERRTSIRHAQSGNIQCLQNAQLFIPASKHRVLTMVTVSQGRNRRGQVRFDKAGSPNFLRTGRTFGRLRLQFAHCRRLRSIGFGATQRIDTSPRTLDTAKSDGMRGSGVEDRIFHRLDSTRFVQPLRKLLAFDGS
jgi:hypothetical protein